jgi:hypothetical protein
MMKTKYLFFFLFLFTACAVKKQPASNYGTFTDNRDGHVYKTVRVGKHVWMAQNLNYKIDGAKYYNAITENGDIYGMLYDFNAARIVAPQGWHLPSALEWQQLQQDCPDPVTTLNMLYAGEFGTGRYMYLGSKATFYTSTPDGMPIMTVYADKGDHTLHFNRQGIGWHLSIRCVKDEKAE